MTPVRAALEAGSHAAAVHVNRERAGEGVSAQVYGLRAKIFEVDGWVRHAQRRVVEVHPEVSFARLAGGPLPDGKRTWAGAHHRRRLLADAGIDLAEDVGQGGPPRSRGRRPRRRCRGVDGGTRRRRRGEAAAGPARRILRRLAAAIWV